MNDNFQPASAAYSSQNENTFRDALRRMFQFFLRGDRDVELRPNVRLILTSPNGTRYAFTVDNAGAWTSTAL